MPRTANNVSGTEAGLTKVRILFVEDTKDDAELAVRLLRARGFDVTYEIVDTDADFRRALAHPHFDIIISDFAMPSFSGLDALRTLQSLELEIPFILVSGAIGEEVAVEAMRSGVDDYLLKNNLQRLGVAVQRELREAKLRREEKLRRGWLELLTLSGRVFTESLDAATVLGRIAKLATQQRADVCIVDVVEDGGKMTRAAVAHRDARRLAELERSANAHPPHWQGLEPVIRGEEKLESILIHDLDEPNPPALVRGVLAVAKTVGAKCVLSVPLQARGRVLGVVSFATETPYAAEEIPLAEEVCRRAALALDNARLYAQAQNAILLRDEFISIASHELNTPVAALRLQLETLRRQIAKQVGPTTDERLNAQTAACVRSLDRLALLVDNLLDVSILSTGEVKMRPARFELCSAAQRVIAQLAGDLARSGCTIEPRFTAVEGVWDRSRIEQVFASLLSNAMRYGPGKPIEVIVEPGDERARLTVRDHGIGISPLDMQRIFGRFERAVSSRHYGGFGLGLFIVKQIVDAHGGTITATSELDSGSTFNIELPLEIPGAKTTTSGVV